MRFISPRGEIDATRILLYLGFIGYTLLAFGATITNSFASAAMSAGTFALAVATLSGLILVLSLNYAAGLVVFLAVLTMDLLYNPPVVIFSTHIAITLMFTEGVSSLRPYRLVATNTRHGPNETVTSNLISCVDRFRRTLILVAISLVALSFAYALLPDVLPIVSDVTTLALYVTISLVAIAITALYLGQRR